MTSNSRTVYRYSQNTSLRYKLLHRLCFEFLLCHTTANNSDPFVEGHSNHAGSLIALPGYGHCTVSSGSSGEHANRCFGRFVVKGGEGCVICTDSYNLRAIVRARGVEGANLHVLLASNDLPRTI